MVPVATYRPASFPVTSAERSCRRLTVGSSPYQSSPTSASAIARRMAAEGFVTVSERRSIGRATGGSEYRGRLRPAGLDADRPAQPCLRQRREDAVARDR